MELRRRATHISEGIGETVHIFNPHRTHREGATVMTVVGVLENRPSHEQKEGRKG